MTAQAPSEYYAMMGDAHPSAYPKNDDTQETAVVPAPVRATAPAPLSQYARFIEEVVRVGTVSPDLTMLRFRAKRWLDADEPDSSESARELKAQSLVTFTRSFLTGYRGFTSGASKPF